MNRRFDDVLKLVASVLFGTSVREFFNLVMVLQKHEVGPVVANLTAILFFLVYFRNIHGLICFDLWAANSAYRDPFDRQTRHSVRDFAFAFFGVLLLPYLFIVFLEHNWLGERPYLFAFNLFAPLAIYWFWNETLLEQLNRVRPTFHEQPNLALAPDSTDGVTLIDRLLNMIRDQVERTKMGLFLWMRRGRGIDQVAMPRLRPRPMSYTEFLAYTEFLEYLMVWRALDRLTYLGIILLLAFSYLAATTNETAVQIFMGERSYEEWFCLFFIVIAFLVTIGDYLFNASFYFPTPNKRS